MVRKSLLVASLVLVAAVPLSAQAQVPVSVIVSTPEFGFRIGAPVYRPIYAPAPMYVPTPVYPPVIYAPAPVVIPAPPVVYRAPVWGVPRVAYPRAYIPPPRVMFPYDREYRYHEPHGQQAGYWTSPGHAKRYSHSDRYQ